jgi:hypothetical protein
MIIAKTVIMSALIAVVRGSSNTASSLAAALASSAVAPTVSDTARHNGNATAQYQLWKWENCHHAGRNSQKDAILDALQEAHTILATAGNYYIGNYWDSMNALEFFGNPPALMKNGGRKTLQTNLRLAHAFTNGGFFTGITTAIYCDDGSLPDKDGVKWSEACGSPDYPDPIVVAPHYHGKDKPALML